MAEINEIPNKRRGLRTGLKKKSTRVDLTPMVDLGFLLLTFFVFTSALSTPMAMKMMVPNDKDSTGDPVCESCVLTVMLGKNNVIWYAVGKNKFDLQHRTGFTPAGIRKLIQVTKRASIKARGTDQFVVIIKPAPESSFKNLVDLVDECTITGVKRYYIDELKPEDKRWLAGGQ